MIDIQRDGRAAWLGFSLKGQRYAVSLASVREVIRCGDITPVPGAPDDVLGIVNLRGQIVPVLDGRRRFGLDGHIEAEAEDAQRVIVFDDAGSVVGMRIDVIGDMLEFDTADVAPPPPGRAARRDDPVSGVITRDDAFIALVDVPPPLPGLIAVPVKGADEVSDPYGAARPAPQDIALLENRRLR